MAHSGSAPRSRSSIGGHSNPDPGADCPPPETCYALDPSCCPLLVLGIVCGVTLAVIGLYGVVSFMVGRRTQEIGIRMTLGAQRSSVLRMVLINGLTLAVVGLAVGLALSFAATPLLRSVLIGISPWDPTTFVVICAALCAATVVASWVPASRATRVDPLVALRHE